jgi:hypothetical protein
VSVQASTAKQLLCELVVRAACLPTVLVDRIEAYCRLFDGGSYTTDLTAPRRLKGKLPHCRYQQPLIGPGSLGISPLPVPVAVCVLTRAHVPGGVENSGMHLCLERVQTKHGLHVEPEYLEYQVLCLVCTSTLMHFARHRYSNHFSRCSSSRHPAHG